MQVASMALVKAVERFDPERGVEFSTFAVPTIQGELKRHFRDKAWAVRVPRRLQELHLELGQAVTELTQTINRSPTIAELAAHLDVSTEEVLEAMEAGRSYRATSLDTGADGEDGSAPIDLGTNDSALRDVEDRGELMALLEDVPPRERTILVLRFFEGLTQSEIAAKLGISQMHVSRLLARTLDDLRRKASASDR